MSSPSQPESKIDPDLEQQGQAFKRLLANQDFVVWFLPWLEARPTKTLIDLDPARSHENRLRTEFAKFQFARGTKAAMQLLTQSVDEAIALHEREKKIAEADAKEHYQPE